MSTDVVLGLAQLAETATGDFTVDEILFELCALAATALDVDGAGVMIAEDGGHLRFSPRRGSARRRGDAVARSRAVVGCAGRLQEHDLVVDD